MSSSWRLRWLYFFFFLFTVDQLFQHPSNYLFFSSKPDVMSSIWPAKFDAILWFFFRSTSRLFLIHFFGVRVGLLSTPLISRAISWWTARIKNTKMTNKRSTTSTSPSAMDCEVHVWTGQFERQGCLGEFRGHWKGVPIGWSERNLQLIVANKVHSDIVQCVLPDD